MAERLRAVAIVEEKPTWASHIANKLAEKGFNSIITDPSGLERTSAGSLTGIFFGIPDVNDMNIGQFIAVYKIAQRDGVPVVILSSFNVPDDNKDAFRRAGLDPSSPVDFTAGRDIAKACLALKFLAEEIEAAY